MSLVGTRPILPDELEQYELHHRARIAIKPGIRITRWMFGIVRLYRGIIGGLIRHRSMKEF